MKKYLFFLVIIFLIILVAAYSGKRGHQDGPSIPQWVATEFRMTEIAYHANNPEDAIKTLNALSDFLEKESKKENPEYAIKEGITVNKWRIAAAVYATGDHDKAIQMIDLIAQSQLGRQLKETEKQDARKEIIGWIINEYIARKPVWGERSVRDMRDYIANQK